MNYRKHYLQITCISAVLLSALAAPAQENRNQASSEQQRQDQAQQQKASTPAPSSAVHPPVVTTAGDIAQKPEQFYGKRVRLAAEVEDTFGNGVFTLDEDKLLAGPDVLVIAPGGGAGPREDTKVTVMGTVRKFTSADVARDYEWYGSGWYGYSWNRYDTVWRDWDTRPVVVADSIVNNEGRELVLRQSQETPAGQQRDTVFRASPGAIAQKPQSYFGNSVIVRAEVAEAYNPHVFTLDEDRLTATQDLLVIVPNPQAAAPEGKKVTVVGSVQAFDRTKLQKEKWFSASLLPEGTDLAEWEKEQRPVLVARSVRNSSGDELVQAPRDTRNAVGGGEDLDETERGEGRQDQTDRNTNTGERY